MGSGCWVCQRGSAGGECYTLAVNVEMGPVFHSHSSQMPLYSVPPPFIPPFRLPLFPPPINDPFVRVFFAAVGWRASAGPSPKTSRLSWNCFLSQSIICGPLSYSLFLLFSPRFPYCRLSLSAWRLLLVLIHNLCPHLTRRLMDFWNSSPPFFVRCCSTFFAPKPPSSLRLSTSSLTLPFKGLQRRVKIDF